MKKYVVALLIVFLFIPLIGHPSSCGCCSDGCSIGSIYSSEVDVAPPVEEDVTDPTVTAFTIPETSDTLTVAISTFTATDDTGVTGYTANESATAPEASAEGWVSPAPTSYTFATEGSKTLYGWAKDAAGNVSTSLSDSVVITLPSQCTTQTTPNDMETSAAQYFLIGSATNNKYASSKFVADSSTGTVCKICLNLNKVGSPTMNFDVQIWADNAGAPSSVVSGGDYSSMNAADIAGTFGDCFTGGAAALTNGTAYHVVIISDAVNSTNYFRWIKDSTCTTESMQVDSDGSSFTETETDRCGMVKLYR